MVNQNLFGSKTRLPCANAVNEAGGPAYRLPPRHALAQLAATGCFHGTYYADAAAQLAALLALVGQVDDNLYLAKGVLAKGSSELVERAVAMARAAGRERATPVEARGLLGIPARISTTASGCREGASGLGRQTSGTE